MALKNRGRTLAAGLLAGVLIGGGFAMVTPAGAAVKEAASAINWKNIWQTEIKPRADKRYFTKKKSNARYYTKIQATSIFESKVAHDASLLNYYTKAQSDANYYTKTQSDANYYTKTQSDANYAPFPTLIRGAYGMINAGNKDATEIDYGVTLSAPPTVHVIAVGAPTPPGCRGTLTAPDADPGNLCIFQRFATNESSLVVCNVDNGCGTTSPFGAWLISFWDGSGAVESLGSWALRPATLAPPAAAITGPKGSVGPAGVD